VASCEGSLRRLQTDVIDLYQIHWPERHVPAFGALYYDPAKETPRPHPRTAGGAGRLVQQGKIRHVGLSNETPYGVHEFVRLAEQHGLPRVASVQNPTACSTAAGKTAGRKLPPPGCGLLAYSPLGFGLLTGKYDAMGTEAPDAPAGRIAKYESVRKQRWGRPEALAAARRYNAWRAAWPDAHAAGAGLLLHQVAGGQHHHRRDQPGAARRRSGAWGTQLSAELLAQIDAIRWQHRDPAQ
jgi:aryl-alcohol dehydrogenase-like predicted oxidoreductase